MKCKTMSSAINNINKFLNNPKKKTIIVYYNEYGLYLKILKIFDKNNLFLEIHTSGFDGKLSFKEAIEWIKMELLDSKVNGFLK